MPEVGTVFPLSERSEQKEVPQIEAAVKPNLRSDILSHLSCTVHTDTLCSNTEESYTRMQMPGNGITSGSCYSLVAVVCLLALNNLYHPHMQNILIPFQDPQ